MFVGVNIFYDKVNVIFYLCVLSVLLFSFPLEMVSALFYILNFYTIMSLMSMCYSDFQFVANFLPPRFIMYAAAIRKKCSRSYLVNNNTLCK